MEEEKYMRRCIQLAQNGLCNAAPNPMVGAVVVCDGKIIGEGYHVRCGEAHACQGAFTAETLHNLRQPGALLPLWKNAALRRPHHREANSSHRDRLPRPVCQSSRARNPKAERCGAGSHRRGAGTGM